MEKLHKVELDILKAFIQVCEKLNLQYYCIGGTAIGVIRHQGFIPWDDDIDVAMPRKDYNRFLEEGQKYLPEHLFIQNPIKENETPWYFAKIRDCNTTFVEEKLKDLDINHGVYIDVFPIDIFPNDEKKREKIFKKYLRLHEIEQYRLYKRPYGDISIRGVFRKIFYHLYSIQYKGVNLKDKILNLLSSNPIEESNYAGTLFGVYGKREIVSSNFFGRGFRAKFEGIDVMVPEQYDAYLTHMYGDYMKLPPKDERVAPHAYFVDLNHSYLYYKEGDVFKWPK